MALAKEARIRSAHSIGVEPSLVELAITTGRFFSFAKFVSERVVGTGSGRRLSPEQPSAYSPVIMPPYTGATVTLRLTAAF